MKHNWTRDQKIMFFCLFVPTALIIGTVGYLVDPVAEKLGALALLVAYGGLVVVIVNQSQDAQDRKMRHDEIVELLREGNKLLGGQNSQGYVVCRSRTGKPNGRVHKVTRTWYLNRAQPDAPTMYWGTPHPTWQAAQAELLAMGDPGKPCGTCHPF